MSKNFKPYYAVIFTSLHNDKIEGYMEMANKMEELAQQQPGFLGIDSARTKIGITVSYWESLEDIKSWKLHTEHMEAQKKGQNQWYKWYHVRVCRVEREYEFNNPS